MKEGAETDINSTTNTSFSGTCSTDLESRNYSGCQFLEEPCSYYSSDVLSSNITSNSSFTDTDNNDNNSSSSSYQLSKESATYSKEQVLPVYNMPRKSSSLKSITTSIQQEKRGCRGKARLWVVLTFCVFVLGAIAAFVCIPRTPQVSMGVIAESLSGPVEWTSNSLQATWQMNVTLDNRQNWVPTRLNRLDFNMVDSLTLVKFAWSTTTAPVVLAPGAIQPIRLVFHVSYQAADATNPTFQNLYNACGPLSETKKERPSLNVLLKVSFHIFGILWTPVVTATPYTGGIVCPFD